MNNNLRQYKTIEERVELFKQFYNRENKHPLLGFFVGSEYPLRRYPSSSSLLKGRALTPMDFDVKLYIKDSEKLFLKHEECGGDFIWSASAFWGIPWLEALLGCDIYANHTTGSIFSYPPDKFVGAESIKKFKPESPWATKAKEFLTKTADASEGRFPLATTRMRGISDLLSALYGGENFIYKMIENPDEVHEVCAKLTDFYIDFAKFQLEYIPDFHNGIGSFYYNCWAPKGTVWHQEDTVAMLSPKLYEEFILKCDEKISTSLNGGIMHQHPVGYLPTQHYINIGMTALELHIDKGGPSAEQLYAKHIKILKNKPLIIWGDISEVDMDWIFKMLPPNGLSIITAVKDNEQADGIWKRYKS